MSNPDVLGEREKTHSVHTSMTVKVFPCATVLEPVKLLLSQVPREKGNVVNDKWLSILSPKGLLNIT